MNAKGIDDVGEYFELIALDMLIEAAKSDVHARRLEMDAGKTLDVPADVMLGLTTDLVEAERNALLLTLERRRRLSDEPKDGAR